MTAPPSLLVTGDAGYIGSHAVAGLASAPVLTLESLRDGGASTQYNLGNGRPTSVRTVIDSVERVVECKVPYTVGPRRPGDPAALYASSARIRKDLGWAPCFEDIDLIVETAWRWREAHPDGYQRTKP